MWGKKETLRKTHRKQRWKRSFTSKNNKLLKGKLGSLLDLLKFNSNQGQKEKWKYQAEKKNLKPRSFLFCLCDLHQKNHIQFLHMALVMSYCFALCCLSLFSWRNSPEKNYVSKLGVREIWFRQRAWKGKAGNLFD